MVVSKVMIVRNSLLLAMLSGLSLILAVLRDRLLAYYVGVGPLLDVYNASFRIPDLVYSIMLALVTAGTLVPFLTEEKNGTIEDPRYKLGSVGLFFAFLASTIALIAFIFIPYIADRIVPGFSEENVELFITMSRLMLLQPIILGFSSLISCFAQLRKEFVLFGLAPIGYSLGIIIGISFFYSAHGPIGLTYGVILGSVLSLFVQAITLREVSFSGVWAKMSFAHVRDLIMLAIPRTGTNIVTQLRNVFFTAFATTLGPGVLTSYVFAERIKEACIQIVQQSITTASLPVLSLEYIEHKSNEYHKTVKRYGGFLGLTGIVVALGLFFVREELVYLLYGDTGANETIIFFLIGSLMTLPLAMISGYLVIALYAAKDMKGVFISYSIASIVAIVVLVMCKGYGLYSLLIGGVTFSTLVAVFLFSVYRIRNR